LIINVDCLAWRNVYLAFVDCNGARVHKKAQQSSVGTATETITVLDRTALVVATVATVAKKIKRRVTYKVDSGRMGVPETTVESSMPTCSRLYAPRPSTGRVQVASQKDPPITFVQKCVTRSPLAALWLYPVSLVEGR
jgi:hypothetical protein